VKFQLDGVWWSMQQQVSQAVPDQYGASMERVKGENLRKSAKTYLSVNLSTLHHGILSRD
jgi:hypothetical protein